MGQFLSTSKHEHQIKGNKEHNVNIILINVQNMSLYTC